MFIHLHCHTHYSFLRAVPSPQELVDAAVAAHAPAVALTDTNGLYGAVPFYQAARAAGIKPIVGTLLDVTMENRKPEEKNGSASVAERPNSDFRFSKIGRASCRERVYACV